MVKIAHLADVHFRGLSRHEEYRRAFKDFFEQCEETKPDHIVIAGDIVHSKTHGISPELVDILTWWFNGMAQVAPTHIILGNHDGLITNKDRQDAISPIVNALNNPNLFLYKKSDSYEFEPGMVFNVFSCFDEENWGNVKPVPNMINIALYHGPVRGSAIESDWQIEGEVEIDIFSGFDFVLLGDIHKTQYLDAEQRIAYPGSVIQQNYGESANKGYLLWEISSKEQYTSRFIEIQNRQPFITLEWDSIDINAVTNGSIPKRSRVRIKHPAGVSRAELNQFKSLLKEKSQTSEIVTRVLNSEVNRNIVTLEDKNAVDLRDPAVVLKLIKDFHCDADYSDETWEEVAVRLRKYCEMIPKTDTARGTRWSIDSMRFDNTFGYGEGNVIDFSTLTGVVGLFGKNRAGKSSIPGSLAYGLFNTSDRGSLKNLHIINTRKNHCKVEIDVTVNSKRYRAQRQSVKRTSRAGVVSASTHLNIFEIDASGEVIKDASGEQRRDTDTILQSLIGEKSDFFLTTFASQGDMNNFIKERATQRKAILANFLDLAVFDSLYDLINRDSAHVKALLSKTPDKNWSSAIVELQEEIKDNKKRISLAETEMSSHQARLASLNLELRELNPDGVITQRDVDEKAEKLKKIQDRIVSLDISIKSTQVSLDEQERKLEKAENLEKSFPLQELEEKLNEQREVERNLLTSTHRLESERKTLKQQKESAKILESVPCGTQFLECKFIKRSHKNAKLIDGQIDLVDELSKAMSVLKKSLGNLLGQDLDEKISKYRDFMKKASALRLEKSEIEITLSDLHRERNDLEETELLLSDQISIMSAQVVDDTGNVDITSIKNKIGDIQGEIRKNDAMRLSLSERIGQDKTRLKQIKKEKKDYENTLSQWKIYDALLTATSKRGVPVHVLNSRLPKINSEIAKILGDSTNFTVELEAPTDSNAMNIFIDYGDSRRPIECASGMEKMLSSLAIRVALINVSILPKSDVLIIDEGFGSLDDINIEACNRLLQSLKKYFKSIIVISHIEGIKDSVDNLIEITKNGVDAHVSTI
jgi:DNA repair exonuclease SbcCD ATPase subunit/DNA repair exonuclease SbcCD nuclease subunit